jgi:hypothetical protein
VQWVADTLCTRMLQVLVSKERLDGTRCEPELDWEQVVAGHTFGLVCWQSEACRHAGCGTRSAPVGDQNDGGRISRRPQARIFAGKTSRVRAIFLLHWEPGYRSVVEGGFWYLVE